MNKLSKLFGSIGVKGLKFLTKDGEVIDPPLYCHADTTSIGGTTYYYHKWDASDGSGTDLSVSGSTTGQKTLGKFVLQLTGMSRILASTIVGYYYTGLNASGVTWHMSITIIIRQADGTVRSTLASDVSVTGNLTNVGYTLATGANYSLSEYTIVDTTDYLEVDYIADVTATKAINIMLRVDDSALSTSNQTRTDGWTYTTSVSKAFTYLHNLLSKISAKTFSTLYNLLQPVVYVNTTLYKKISDIIARAKTDTISSRKKKARSELE